MELIINVEDLLEQRKIESNMIEFKKGCSGLDLPLYLCVCQRLRQHQWRVLFVGV